MKFKKNKALGLLLFFYLGTSYAQSVGTTEGVFNVSDMGAANYSIPIKVPDGIGGLQPNLFLNYSSQGGNGPLGMGWSIGGLSVITRTGNNIYHDKRTKGIDLTLNDRYALDGNRLIVTGGAYGGAGSVYHTEVETFKDVTAVGSLGNGPLSFTVKDQNGLTYEYGNTAIARVVATGKTEPYLWYLNKVIDLNGNYMTIDYNNSNGEVLPTYIRYNCNQNTGVTYQSYVSFSYAVGSTPNFSYLAGGKMQSTKRIDKISVIQKEGTLWKYFKSYIPGYSEESYSHLVKITERGVGQLEELAPTEFTYGDAAVNNTTTSKAELQNAMGTSFSQCIGDYNGDGLSDILDFSTLNGGNFKLSLRNQNGTYSLAQTGTFENGFAGNYNQNLIEYNQSNTVNFDYNGDGKSDFATFQNYNPSSTIVQQMYWVYQSNGTELSSIGAIVRHDNPSVVNPKIFGYTMPFIGDFDGDGKTEILLLNTLKASDAPTGQPNPNYIIGERYNTYTTNLGYPAYKARDLGNALGFDAAYIASNASKLLVIDYDGDGKNEILSIWKDNAANVTHAQILRLNVTFDANNNPVIGNPTFILVNDGTFPELGSKLFPGDFNGDGITDILTETPVVGATNSIWLMGYGTGNGLFEVMVAPSINASSVGPGGYQRPLLIADFNGDGKDDIFDYGSGTPYYAPKIHFSKGNNIFSVEQQQMDLSMIGLGSSGYKLGDFNGDGSIDFMTRNYYYALPYECNFHPNETRHLMSKIKDGLGAITEVNYLPLTNSTVYSSGSSVYTYPYVKRTIPLKVVANVKVDNGINTTGNLVSYSYVGLKYHAQGKGIMGFDRLATLDDISKISNQKDFGLNLTYAFPYLSSTSSKYSKFPILSTISEAVSVYGVYDYGNKRIFPYVTSSTENNFLTGQVTTTTNNYVFSNGQYNIAGRTYSFHNGKPYSITTNKGNGLEVTTQSFSYPDYSSGGLLGGAPVSYLPLFIYSRPASTTTTNTRQGQPSYSRKSDFTYNNTNGWLLTTTTDPNTSNAVTASFWYDSYGNPVRKLIAAAGLASKDRRMVYDLSNRYVKESYDAAFPNIKNQTSYDAVTGLELTNTDPDGLFTSYTYDGFGRIKTVTDNNGLSTTTTYGLGLAPGDNFPDGNSTYYIGTTTNIGAASYICYDRLGRAVKSGNKNFQNQWVRTIKDYNNKGQLVLLSKPSSSLTYQATTYNYDIYGRMIHIIAPEGNTQLSYSLSNGYYTVSQTNPLGQQTKVKTDASAYKIEVIDATGNALSYIYHSNGSEKTVSSLGNVLQTYAYDDYGQLKERIDPNYGSELTTYNAFGETITSKDVKGNVYNFNYDALGRMFKKTGSEGIYNYVYNNNTGENCGKLIELSGPEGAISYTYGRGNKVNSIVYDDYQSGAIITGNSNYSLLSPTAMQYDVYGRLLYKQFPTGAKIQYAYSPTNGDLIGIYDSYTGSALYKKTGENDLGQTTSYNQNLGVGSISTTNSYDSYGFLIEQKTQSGSGTLVRDYKYSFDQTSGNLLQRKDVKYNLEENFAFDNLNRLTDISYPTALGLNNIHLGFEANGNINKKTDAGDFTYDQANRLSKIENVQNIPTVMQTVEYAPFDKVNHITEGGTETDIHYWPTGARRSMATYKGGQLDKYKTYGPNFEKSFDRINGDKTWTYIKVPEGNVVAIIAAENGQPKNYLVLTDHLGSFTHVIDDNNNVVEEKNFDAWGRLRNPLNWQSYASNVSAGQPNYLFDRGYTGHEHLPEYGIINMNGRLYDPVMGRMFSPDPVIIGKDNLQGYNRYTYALNNPLSYSDPDGRNPLFIAMGIGAAVSALSYMNYHVQSGTSWDWGQFGYGIIKQGLTSGMTYGIGSAFGSIGTIGHELFRAGAHGSAGFVASGGSLSQAGISAAGSFAGSFAANFPILNTTVGGLGFSMGVGGATSTLSGGSFVNGAVTAGLIGIINHEFHEDRNPAQDKILSKGDIKKLEASGWNHMEKGDHGGQTDLYKDKEGNVYQKPKGGAGYGDPTGLNLNDLENVEYFKYYPFLNPRTYINIYNGIKYIKNNYQYYIPTGCGC